jgi:5'(3')-deoxyribonucleotidase
MSGFLAVLVPAGFYSKTLIQTIADTSRERDSVAVTSEMVIAQLQSGHFLVLFDGLTEVAGEGRRLSSQEIFSNFCGDKGIVDADYMIDDEPRHFRSFRGTGILFSAPHNLEETAYERVSSWHEIRQKLLGSG